MGTSTVGQATGTRDPMVYDVMRETANRLGGEYIARANDCRPHDPAGEAYWLGLDLALRDEVDDVDPRDQDLVRAMTAEFSARRRALPTL
jgi:hypothetical protein